MYDIAIIGLGATGVSLISQLQDEIYSSNLIKPKIAVINPSNNFSTGNAFGDADKIHKVNTPPNLLSVSYNETNSFKYWLKRESSSEDNYPARIQFSIFLSQLYHSIKSSDVLDITEFYSTVINLEKDNNKFIITDDRNNTIYSKTVIMCLGAKVTENFPQLSTIKGFIHHFKEYSDTYNKILIAGSSLTAIDAFRYVNSKGNNDVNLFSRNGYLPTCLTRSNQYIPIFLTWQNIIYTSKKSGDIFNTFVDLLRKELHHLKIKGEFNQAINFLRKNNHKDYFSFLLQRAKEANLPFQDVLVSTRPYMHKIWNIMNLSQKNKFIKNFGSIWASWRHPIPQIVFSELHEALINKNLKFHKLLSEPIYHENKFVIQTQNGRICANIFWDATGGKNNITLMKDKLLTSLREKNLIEPHPCGGININTSTFECIVKNKTVDGLYNLGPLNKGCLFSTNAFWFNTQCANILAKNLIRILSFTKNKEPA